MIVCIVVFTQSRKLSSISLRNLSFFACHACKSIYFQPRKHQSCNDCRIFSTAAHFPVLHTCCIIFRARHQWQAVLGIVSCFSARPTPTHAPPTFQPVFPRLTADTCFPALDAGYSFSRAWQFTWQRSPACIPALDLKPVCVVIASAHYLCLVWLTKCDWFVSFSVNCNIFQICYGLTETSPVTNQTLMDDPVDLRVSTVGRVHPNTEVRISRTQKSNK